jgi:phenylpyruvate tautomerase PptA (4-oxalocrotonate tautomerase family)
MPILRVEVVADPETGLEPTLAQRLADEAGRVLGAEPGTTWVTVEVIPSARYAESGAPTAREVGYRPVFVRVLKRAWPEVPARAAEVGALTAAMAEICGRPRSEVHVIYEPPGGGRVAFGGALVE